MSLSLLKASAAAFILGASAASAATFTGNYAVSFNSNDPGLVVDVAPTSGTGSFDLEVGQSFTFNIFDLWTTETAVNADDKAAQPISVDFSLTAPAAGNAVVTGTTKGVTSFFGIKQAAKLDWADPVILAFGTTGQLRIELSDATFQAGYFGLDTPYRTVKECQQKSGRSQRDCEEICKTYKVFNGAEVMATLTYVTADTPAPVPLPAAGLGLVAGLGALGLLRRKR